MNELEKEKEILERVLRTLKRVNVNWWLDQGTLLGVIRDGDLLPWDHDIDIGVWHEEFHRDIGYFIELCLSEGLRVQVNPWSVKVLLDGRSNGYRLVDIEFYSRDDGRAIKVLRSKESGSFLGLCKAMFLHYLGRLRELDFQPPSGRFKRLVADGICLLLSKPVRSIISDWAYIRQKTLTMSVESVYFDSLVVLNSAGLTLNVPSNAEDLLEKKYGPDWKTPKKDWNHMTDDGTIILPNREP
jgi:hypothetical protein